MYRRLDDISSAGQSFKETHGDLISSGLESMYFNSPDTFVELVEKLETQGGNSYKEIFEFFYEEILDMYPEKTREFDAYLENAIQRFMTSDKVRMHFKQNITNAVNNSLEGDNRSYLYTFLDQHDPFFRFVRAWKSLSRRNYESIITLDEDEITNQDVEYMDLQTGQANISTRTPVVAKYAWENMTKGAFSNVELRNLGLDSLISNEPVLLTDTEKTTYEGVKTNLEDNKKAMEQIPECIQKLQKILQTKIFDAANENPPNDDAHITQIIQALDASRYTPGITNFLSGDITTILSNAPELQARFENNILLRRKIFSQVLPRKSSNRDSIYRQLKTSIENARTRKTYNQSRNTLTSFERRDGTENQIPFDQFVPVKGSMTVKEFERSNVGVFDVAKDIIKSAEAITHSQISNNVAENYARYLPGYPINASLSTQDQFKKVCAESARKVATIRHIMWAIRSNGCDVGFSNHDGNIPEADRTLENPLNTARQLEKTRILVDLKLNVGESPTKILQALHYLLEEAKKAPLYAINQTRNTGNSHQMISSEGNYDVMAKFERSRNNYESVKKILLERFEEIFDKPVQSRFEAELEIDKYLRVLIGSKDVLNHHDSGEVEESVQYKIREILIQKPESLKSLEALESEYYEKHGKAWQRRERDIRQKKNKTELVQIFENFHHETQSNRDSVMRNPTKQSWLKSMREIRTLQTENKEAWKQKYIDLYASLLLEKTIQSGLQTYKESREYLDASSELAKNILLEEHKKQIQIQYEKDLLIQATDYVSQRSRGEEYHALEDELIRNIVDIEMEAEHEDLQKKFIEENKQSFDLFHRSYCKSVPGLQEYQIKKKEIEQTKIEADWQTITDQINEINITADEILQTWIETLSDTEKDAILEDKVQAINNATPAPTNPKTINNLSDTERNEAFNTALHNKIGEYSSIQAAMKEEKTNEILEDSLGESFSDIVAARKFHRAKYLTEHEDEIQAALKKADAAFPDMHELLQKRGRSTMAAHQALVDAGIRMDEDMSGILSYLSFKDSLSDEILPEYKSSADHPISQQEAKLSIGAVNMTRVIENMAGDMAWMLWNNTMNKDFAGQEEYQERGFMQKLRGAVSRKVKREAAGYYLERYKSAIKELLSDAYNSSTSDSFRLDAPESRKNDILFELQKYGIIPTDVRQWEKSVQEELQYLSKNYTKQSIQSMNQGNMQAGPMQNEHNIDLQNIENTIEEGVKNYLSSSDPDRLNRLSRLVEHSLQSLDPVMQNMSSQILDQVREFEVKHNQGLGSLELENFQLQMNWIDAHSGTLNSERELKGRDKLIFGRLGRNTRSPDKLRHVANILGITLNPETVTGVGVILGLIGNSALNKALYWSGLGALVLGAERKYKETHYAAQNMQMKVVTGNDYKTDGKSLLGGKNLEAKLADIVGAKSKGFDFASIMSTLNNFDDERGYQADRNNPNHASLQIDHNVKNLHPNELKSIIRLLAQLKYRFEYGATNKADFIRYTNYLSINREKHQIFEAMENIMQRIDAVHGAGFAMHEIEKHKDTTLAQLKKAQVEETKKIKSLQRNRALIGAALGAAVGSVAATAAVEGKEWFMETHYGAAKFEMELGPDPDNMSMNVHIPAEHQLEFARDFQTKTPTREEILHWFVAKGYDIPVKHDPVASSNIKDLLAQMRDPSHTLVQNSAITQTQPPNMAELVAVLKNSGYDLVASRMWNDMLNDVMHTTNVAASYDEMNTNSMGHTLFDALSGKALFVDRAPTTYVPFMNGLLDEFSRKVHTGEITDINQLTSFFKEHGIYLGGPPLALNETPGTFTKLIIGGVPTAYNMPPKLTEAVNSQTTFRNNDVFLAYLKQHGFGVVSSPNSTGGNGTGDILGGYITEEVNDRTHYNYNTEPRHERNELRLWRGANQGINSDGTYSYSVSRMFTDESFTRGLRYSPSEIQSMIAGNDGKVFLGLTVNDASGNKVIRIPIDANGVAQIDPRNSELMNQVFQNENGKLEFKGKFLEVMVDNGGGNFDILATLPGDNTVPDGIPQGGGSPGTIGKLGYDDLIPESQFNAHFGYLPVATSSTVSSYVGRARPKGPSNRVRSQDQVSRDQAQPSYERGGTFRRYNPEDLAFITPNRAQFSNLFNGYQRIDRLMPEKMTNQALSHLQLAALQNHTSIDPTETLVELDYSTFLNSIHTNNQNFLDQNNLEDLIKDYLITEKRRDPQFDINSALNGMITLDASRNIEGINIDTNTLNQNLRNPIDLDFSILQNLKKVELNGKIGPVDLSQCEKLTEINIGSGINILGIYIDANATPLSPLTSITLADSTQLVLLDLNANAYNINDLFNPNTNITIAADNKTANQWRIDNSGFLTP